MLTRSFEKALGKRLVRVAGCVETEGSDTSTGAVDGVGAVGGVVVMRGVKVEKRS